ncbi:MAG TPA: ATP phosphoribosyltransferase [Verrucomicrobiae bacterium]|jgi:ATP phosphoribosyltransferase|nr:ATP phosphoribosyltransferase [Verrucomicrobiae bacterium]
MDADRLRLAMQRSGRLSDASFELLSKCGLHISRSRTELFCRIEELPIDLLLVRDDDIPGFVEEGVCDLGIVGENVVEEKRRAAIDGFKTATILPLGYARCRLVLAVQEGRVFRDLSDLKGLRIATTYPATLKAMLTAAKVDAEIVVMNGSVEVAPRLHIADAICDIVQTGATLEANGLKPVHTLLDSQALLIGRKDRLNGGKSAIAERLIKRIQGALKASEAKYIMLHAPRSALPAIARILPGAESPTVLPLESMPDKVAVHAVSRESVFWETMEQLKAAGASAILVLPIEKMMD